ncbi:MAG: hypothetical protein IKL37_04725 [Alphaproteobacteria bacterium]|nr:hypothetical protein [Alphaproteobacteria bacterium]
MDILSESGIITDNGQLRLPMDRLNAFFAANKGKRVVVRFEAAAPGSTALQQAYYYNYVIPCVVEALREQGTRKSEDATDRWLISQYPGGFRYDGAEQHVARQLTTTQMSDFLDWLKQYAAENLYVYIEDPRTL